MRADEVPTPSARICAALEMDGSLNRCAGAGATVRVPESAGPGVLSAVTPGVTPRLRRQRPEDVWEGSAGAAAALGCRDMEGGNTDADILGA